MAPSGFLWQSSLCLPSSRHSAPGAGEQLLGEVPSRPRWVGEEVRLSVTITRSSSSPGGTRGCWRGLRGGGKAGAADGEVLVSDGA